jgi:uncharacterized protein YbgA (DUF1722 family)/uncharacterized protein YbbK (DUF523 family)
MKAIERPVRLGISSCLAGEAVRYNGGHLSDSFLMGTLADHVEWVTVCPEFEVGMGVPREEIRLVGSPDDPRLIGSRSETDHTVPMRNWAKERTLALADPDLDGFVLTANSPSCGLVRVRVYQSKGAPAVKQGVGVFARALTEGIPDLPVEENGRLHDPRLRENFVERIFVRRRWHQMLEDDPTPGGLVRFHTAHKLTFMAHSNAHYRSVGRLVASAGTIPWGELIPTYQIQMAEALRLIATPKKNTNVLHHLMGFLKDAISPDDKQELLDLIDQYRSEQLPLIVPLTLLKHHLRKPGVPDWVHVQAYLNPYPFELMLRNHV